jgi:hypothetical protein
MINMPGLRHVHRYVKATLGRNKWPIYKCDLPDCSHYISAELVEGKFSICHRCGERFILDRKALELAKPHCRSCTEKKVNPEAMQVAEKLMEEFNLDDFLTSPNSERISESDTENENLNEFDEMMFEDTTNSKD